MMKLRTGLLISALLTFSLLISSCGSGGGPSATLNSLHRSDFYMAQGVNPSSLANSDFLKSGIYKLKNLTNELTGFLKDAYLYNSSISSYRTQLTVYSREGSGNITYINVPIKVEFLKRFFRENNGWDLEEKTRDKQTYYVNRKTALAGENAEAFMMVSGGFLHGSVDTIEEYIRARKNSKKHLATDKDFERSKRLIDFSASKYNLIWDNMSVVRNQLLERLFRNENTRLSKDADFEKAIEDILGYGISEYYTTRYEIVHRILFDKTESAKAFEEVIDDKSEEFLEKHYDLIMPDLSNRMVRKKAERYIDNLVENVTVNRSGNIVEFRLHFTWPDVEDLYADDE